jgi:hypothetical protein
MVISNLGRPAEGAQRLEAFRAEVEAASTVRQRFEHRSALAYALNLEGRLGATALALRETVTLAEQAGDLMEVMVSLGNLAATQALGGHVRAARDSQRAALQLRQRTGVGDGAYVLPFQMNLGMMAAQLGEYAEALDLLEPLPARMAAMGPLWAGTAANHLASLWMMLGQPHRAEAAMRAVPSAEHPTLLLRGANLRTRLARLAGEAQPPELEQALMRHAAVLGIKNTGAAQLELSRVVEPLAALARVREVRRAASAAEMAGLALHALMREVDLLLQVDPGHAVHLAAELACRDPDVAPTDAYGPEVDWVLARCAAAAGDVVAQQAWVAKGLAWVERAAAGLPPGLRRAFLEHNPVNAALLKARRTGG